MKKFLEKTLIIINKIIEYFNIFLEYLFKHYFSINVIYASLLIIFILLTKGTVSDIDTGILKEIHLSFFKYTIIFGAIAFMSQAIFMFMFERKTKKYKKELTTEGFNKFIEYEYKKNDKSFFSGLAYIFSICIGILAIYLSITAMALSVDIVLSNNGEVKIEGTEYMLSILAEWIGLFIVIFPVYFIGYKFNTISKRIFLEMMYYGEYKK